MTEIRESKQGRIVLSRFKGSRFQHLLGIGVASLPLIYLVWLIVSGWWNKYPFDLIVGLVGLAFATPIYAIVFGNYFRRFVLSDNHISIESWHGVPRVYAYDQIADIENVVANFWYEGEVHVKLTFDDGKTVKVPRGLIGAAKFRKILQEKSGRKFRKKRVKKK